MKSSKNILTKTKKISLNINLKNNDNFINKWLPNITDCERKEITKRLNLKGWFIYEKICKYLKNNNIPISVNQIQSIFIYDKRIRKTLFKYVGMIEEQYRSMLYNYLDYSDCITVETSFTYNDLIDILEEHGICDNIETHKLRIIKSLRNDICHHNLLIIDSYGYKNNEIYDAIGVLESLIKNKEIAKSFVDDLLRINTKPLNKDKYHTTLNINIPIELDMNTFFTSKNDKH